MSNRLFWIVVFLVAAVLLVGGVLAQYRGMTTHFLPPIMPFTPVTATINGDIEITNYRAVIVKVIDGDTLDVIISVPVPWGKSGMFLMVPERIRVCCIDTPEISKAHAKCEAEIQLGQKAKDYLAGLLQPMAKVLLSEVSWTDKYGRVLAKVTDLSGQNIGEVMIGQGLARSYHGEAKSSWCGN